MHSGLFIICCRAKAFLQLGLGDNQHSFLLKPGLQKRPFSSVAHPFNHPICPRAPKPVFLTWFQLPKKQRVHLKAERPKYLSAEMKARIVTRWQMDLSTTGLWNVHELGTKSLSELWGRGTCHRLCFVLPEVTPDRNTGSQGGQIPKYVLAGEQISRQNFWNGALKTCLCHDCLVTRANPLMSLDLGFFTYKVGS